MNILRLVPLFLAIAPVICTNPDGRPAYVKPEGQVEKTLAEACWSLTELEAVDEQYGPFDWSSIVKGELFADEYQGGMSVAFLAKSAEVMQFFVDKGFDRPDAFQVLIDESVPVGVLQVLIDNFPQYIEEPILFDGNLGPVQILRDNGISRFELANHYYYGSEQTPKIKELLAEFQFIRNSYSRTPLQLAITTGRPELVKMLLKAGALVSQDMDSSNEEISELLYTAAKIWNECNYNMAMLRQVTRGITEQTESSALRDGLSLDAEYVEKKVFDQDKGELDPVAVRQYKESIRKTLTEA